MNILITGAKGFVGTHLYNSFNKSFEKAKNALSEPHKVFMFEGDIRRAWKLKRHYDLIYHLAANTDPRFPDHLEMYRTNVQGFINLLQYAVKEKSQVIYASSASCQGDWNKTPYAKSKMMMDLIGQDYYKENKIVGLRFVNIYGPGEVEKGRSASMITQWALQLIANQRPRAFQEERKTKRDYIYVKDAVKALRLAIGNPSGVYDVGTGKPHSFDYVLKLVQKYLGIHRKPIYISNPYKGRYQQFTKAKLNWGFKPDFSLEEGIKDYLTGMRGGPRCPSAWYDPHETS